MARPRGDALALGIVCVSAIAAGHADPPEAAGMPPSRLAAPMPARNPFFERPGWSVKDACIATREGTTYLFASAFFESGDRVRSHLMLTSTEDFETWSTPSIRDGTEEGWIGLCSPSVCHADGTWVVTYNSWGDKPGRRNALFYAVSDDLETWSWDLPLAHSVTGSDRAIDAALARQTDRWILVWKKNQTPAFASAPSLDGPWRAIGEPDLGWFENAQLIEIDGVWHLLATRTRAHEPWITRLTGDPATDAGWLEWSDWKPLVIPRQSFNTDHRANAAFLVDSRDAHGLFTLVYAGRTEGESAAGRGDNRLGMAYSKDLVSWTALPD